MDTSSLQEKATPTFEVLLTQISEDYEQTQKELKEMEVLIRQSSAEVEKLAQRNAQIATKLRQMEANLDTVPRPVSYTHLTLPTTPYV
jgi:septal ring factor EnvC (AmiA/AmiB activator)